MKAKEEKQVASIDLVDITDYPYEALDKIYYYSAINNTGFYDLTKSVPSFSKGVEGLLELWDVRLKWRLNRLFNPMYYGTTSDEIDNNEKRFKSGYISDAERNEFFDWVNKFTSKKYLEDEKMLKKLFEIEYYEMTNSHCFALDLKEGVDFDLKQIDPKKKNNRHPVLGLDVMAKAQYGSYSNLDSDIADKWNLHTLQGKDIRLEPWRIKKITNGENTDMLSVISIMYDKYKKSVSSESQVEFDVLDKYIEYTKNRGKNIEDTVETSKPKVFQLSDKGFSNILLLTLITGFASGIISTVTFILLHKL